MNDLPTNYAKSPITPPPGSLEKTLQPTMDGVEKNFNLVQQSIVSIIAFCKFLAGAVSDLQSAVSSLTKRVIIIEETLDGIVDASLFNRTQPGNIQNLNAATILAAAASITGLPKTLYLKRGTWMIDADVDLSAMASSLLLAPGAELQQVGSFTMSLPLNVTIPDQGFHFSGDTGFIIPKVGSRLTLSPQWFGALETSDSTDALIAFEEATFAQETSMVLPAGDYGFDGRWEVRMGIAGYGVTIAQLDTTKQSAVADSTIYSLNHGPGFFMRGQITVNSADARVGIHIYGADYFELGGVTSEHSVHMGFYLSNSDEFWVHECNSNYVTYVTNPSTGKSADGFYHYSCRNPKYENCNSFDVERMNFVSEGNPAGPFPSYRPSYFRCTGDYAHNHDHSTTEFNGAFWAENTNGADYIECNAVNIGSGDGQLARFARCFTVGSGTTEYCDFNYTNCKIYGNAGSIATVSLRGWDVFSGSGASYAKVNIVDCFLDKIYQGIVIEAGIREVNIIRPTVSNSTVALLNAASVFITATNDLLALTVDGLSEVNTTRHADGGSVCFFQAAPNCNYTLKNSHGITHACVTVSGSAAKMRVSDCDITFGCTNRVSFSAPDMEADKTKFTVRPSSNGRLWQYSGTQDDAHCYIDQSGLKFDATADAWVVGANTADFKLSNSYVRDGWIRHDNTGAGGWVNYESVKFTDYPAARGAVQANANTRVTITDCTSFCAAGAQIPYRIQPATAGPITSVLSGNHYQVAAALDNFAAPTLGANQPY